MLRKPLSGMAKRHQRQGYRSGKYTRKLGTTSGEVTLKVPKLKGVPFETADKVNKYLKLKYLSIRIPIIIEFYDIIFYITERDKIIPIDKNILNSERIDIVLFIDNYYFLIELKYSAYDELASKENYRAGANKYEILKEYKADVRKLENLINNFVCIKSGYCILIITSNLLQELNINEIDESLEGYAKPQSALRAFVRFCLRYIWGMGRCYVTPYNLPQPSVT